MLCQTKIDVPGFPKGSFIDVDLEEDLGEVHYSNGHIIFVLKDSLQEPISSFTMAEPYDFKMFDELFSTVEDLEQKKKILFIDKTINRIEGFADMWPFKHGFYIFPEDGLETTLLDTDIIFRAKRILMLDFMWKAALESSAAVYQIAFDEKFPSYFHLFKIIDGEQHHVYFADSLGEAVNYFDQFALPAY